MGLRPPGLHERLSQKTKATLSRKYFQCKTLKQKQNSMVLLTIRENTQINEMKIVKK